MTHLDAAIEHARQTDPEECCGLVVRDADGHLQILRGQNVAENRRVDFRLAPRVWVKARALGFDVVGVYHSHSDQIGPWPSPMDQAMCTQMQMPWDIVTPDGRHFALQPSPAEVPYEQRPYIFRIYDCYTIVRDWYKRERGVQFQDWDYPKDFWKQGLDLYGERFAAEGFERMPEGTPLEVGDVMIILMQGEIAQHAGIYLGNDRLLHHLQGQLSEVTMYSGFYASRTRLHLRHKGAQ